MAIRSINKDLKAKLRNKLTNGRLSGRTYLYAIQIWPPLCLDLFTTVTVGWGWLEC